MTILDDLLRPREPERFTKEVQRHTIGLAAADAMFRLHGPPVQLDASAALHKDGDARLTKLFQVPSRIEVQLEGAWKPHPVLAYLLDPYGYPMGFAVCAVDAFYLFPKRDIDTRLFEQAEQRGLAIAGIEYSVE